MKYPTVFRVDAEPTLFMDAKFKRTRRYFATMRRARSWARIYCYRNPCGEAVIAHKPRRVRATP